MKLWRWALPVVAALSLGALPAAAQQALRPGVAANGELRQGDRPLNSGEFSDVYTVQAQAGQVITVTMSSSEFDTYIMVRGPDNFADDNDDAPGQGTNSEISVTAPTNGTYNIIATSFQPGETGRYQITATTGAANALNAAAPAQGQARPAQSQARPAQSQATPTQSTAAPLRPQPALTLGGTVNGALSTADGTRNRGEFLDAYTLSGRAGQRIEILMNSSAIDPYLQVEGPGVQAFNDDDVESGTTNSRLVLTLPEDGTYTVYASSYMPGETGNYQLTVRDAGNLPVSGPAQSLADMPGASLALGQVISGDLGQGDDQLVSGEFVERFTFEGRTGQRVRIAMTSSTVDAYIILVAPNGGQEENDDAAAGVTDSRLDAVLSQDGVYTVIATTYRPGEAGAFQLSVNDLSRPGVGAPQADPRPGPTRPIPGGQTTAPSAASPPPVAPPAGAATLVAGRPTQGQLAATDLRLRSGEFTDVYTFTGTRGQRATLSLSSDAFDPYLILNHPDGTQVDNDDAGDGTLNSQISLVLPADGVYTVTATSYQPGETGPYTLEMAFQATGVDVNRQMAGGRVFAVMVGVSDYGGTANNLAFTAEDAQKLSQTLQENGVLAEGSVVLTDARATVGNVRQAFQQVAALAGPEDTFMFFFSGHGVQRRSAVSATEPDGYEELIVMRDGEISDDELAGWFGQVRARVSLLAIDACFAGGFARDVVSRPNIMGVFSSEEDLTSSVADKFRAGGYLSYFLRNGLAGDSDSDGDAIITAGELSAYLRREFANELEIEATTTDGQRNYQFLVVDRGGVKIDDMLIALR
jgi:Caspase domain/Bacterial pre-peptidase C-terminal domain